MDNLILQFDNAKALHRQTVIIVIDDGDYVTFREDAVLLAQEIEKRVSLQEWRGIPFLYLTRSIEDGVLKELWARDYPVLVVDPAFRFSRGLNLRP